jgi:hypothetical protein
MGVDDSSVLKMEAAGSSEMSETFKHTTYHDILEDWNFLVALLVGDST